MIVLSRMAGFAVALFARLEPHHWVAVGASVALHLAVILGWPSEPPPEPQAIQFEIAFEPPAAEPLSVLKERTKPLAKQPRPRKVAAKKKPRQLRAQHEPHLLDANWRAESKTGKDAPALALPDAIASGAQAVVAGDAQDRPRTARLEASETNTRADTQPSSRASAGPQAKHAANAANDAAAGAASAGGPGLSEPDAAGIGGASGRSAESGVTLANSPTQAAHQALSPENGGAGAQESGAVATLATLPAASGSGASQGGLQTAQVSQTALHATSGAGTAAASVTNTVNPAAAKAGGDEPQGVRLSTSGALVSAPALPAGPGSLAAGPRAAALTGSSAQSARANPSSSAVGGSGLATSSAVAGGALFMPARAGAAQDNSGGVGAGRGGPRREATGRLGVATATPAALPGLSGAASTPGRSIEAGTSVALAPGEPGGSPGLAVSLQPLVASLANPYLPARTARSGAGASREPAASSVNAGGSRGASQPTSGLASPTLAASVGHAAPVSGRVAASSGGVGGLSVAPRLAASAAVLDAARDAGQMPVVLRAAQVVPVQVVRPDTEIQRLEVLAPSNYCPLPLPGHSQPENRAPLPDRNLIEQPAYALDNPVITYPVLANIRGVEGRVTVRVEVMMDGRPGKMWLKQSSGSGILDSDAQAQLKQWRFVPARKNGQTVTAWIDVPVLYRLNESR